MGGIVSRIGRAMFRGLVRLCCYAPSPKSTLGSRGPGPYLRQQRRSSIRLDQQQPTRCCKYQIPKCVNDPSSLCFCDLRDETHICTVQGLVEGQQAIIEDCEVHFSTSVVASYREVMFGLGRASWLQLLIGVCILAILCVGRAVEVWMLRQKLYGHCRCSLPPPPLLHMSTIILLHAGSLTRGRYLHMLCIHNWASVHLLFTDVTPNAEMSAATLAVWDLPLVHFADVQLYFFFLVEIDQVATMKVSDWSNQWTKVFDFTENPPTMHWGFLPETCPDLSKQTVLEECCKGDSYGHRRTQLQTTA